MADVEMLAAADLLRRHRNDERMMAQFARIPRPALLAIMDIAGLMRRRSDNLPGHVAAYHDGMAALALEILTRAGFDPVSQLVAGITGSLEGEQRHDDASAERTGRPVLDEPGRGDDEY